jgi:hypothetical protein
MKILSAYLTRTRSEGRLFRGNMNENDFEILSCGYHFCFSAKESFLPRKDLESWECCWDSFLLVDRTEGEQESFLLMDILEEVVGFFCQNCAGMGLV